MILFTPLYKLYSLFILTPFRWIELIVACLRNMCIIMTLTIIGLYKYGMIHRFIHRFIETELSKICNGATVTIANVEYIFFTSLSSSTIIIHDAVIHTPQRNEWQWDSPLIARIGKTQVTFNLYSVLNLPDGILHVIKKLFHIQGMECTTSKRTMISLSSQGSKEYPNLFQFLLLFKNIPLREIYTIQMEDVQVFVEKRRNVFNFHLLDDSLDIPDPTPIMNSLTNTASLHKVSESSGTTVVPITTTNLVSSVSSSNHSSPTAILNKAATSSYIGEAKMSPTAVSSSGGTISPIALFPSRNNHTGDGLSTLDSKTTINTTSPTGKKNSSTTTTTTTTTTVGVADDSTSTQTANEILNHMMGAVSNISKAVNEGKGISTVLKNQKDGFVSHLKQFLTVSDRSTSTGAASASPVATHSSSIHPSYIKSDSGDSTNSQQNSNTLTTKSMGVIAKEGLQVIKQVGKVVEQNVMDMKKVVDNISKPPPKKVGWDIINYDLFRIGRITFREVRVFTKDVFSNRSTPSSTSTTNMNTDNSNTSIASSKQDSITRMDTTGWSKPVLVKEVILTSMDLCPPSKNLDEDGIHAIGQRIDVLADIVMKRLLAEMAKSNTGLLLNNALGEVFSVFESKRVIGGGSSHNTSTISTVGAKV